MSDSKPLRIDSSGFTRVLTLDRPDRRNALTRDLLEQLIDALHSASIDPSVRVVLLTGSGGSFSSGVDLKDPRATDGPPYPEVLHRLAATVRAVPKPVLAAIEGYAYGAGLAFALAADIRLAHPDARLAEAYIRIGRYPGGGDAVMLPRLVGTSRALRMLWTGQDVLGADALAWGLVDELHDDPRAAALSLAETLGAMPEEPLALVKHAVYGLRSLPFDDALTESLRFARGQDKAPNQ